MGSEQLQVRARPNLDEGRLILAFSGWMDGGDVSTGTVKWLAETLTTQKVASIRPEGFYIYSFPGSMEISTLFRPHTEVVDGLIRAYEPPANDFFCDPRNNVLLFSGKEPHFGWENFADCLFDFAKQVGVAAFFFVGSFAGTVPHTRQPRLVSTVSDVSLKNVLEPFGIRFTNYEGPASFSTYLMTQAARRGFCMANLVAEIPAYIQGPNPKSIEAVIHKLTAILGLQVDTQPLREVSDAWEKRLNEVLEDEQDLAHHIEKLEADYDNEHFDTELGDLKKWLVQRGVRVD